MHTTDAELVKACLAGGHGAWETIVRQYHLRIYNLAYRFTGRFDQAEDLTQEIFLKVYRTLGSYRSESGALVTWIIRVGRNHIIDHYRKTKTERTRTDSLEVEYEKAEENPSLYLSPAQALERREDSERIHRALLRISEDLREAVILRDLEGFSLKEVIIVGRSFPVHQAPEWLPARILANTPVVARETWIETLASIGRWIIAPRTAMAVFTATLVLGWLGSIVGVSPDWVLVVRNPAAIYGQTETLMNRAYGDAIRACYRSALVTQIQSQIEQLMEIS